eukprot:5443194-Pleurochrysis_carterae.AAC.1
MCQFKLAWRVGEGESLARSISSILSPSPAQARPRSPARAPPLSHDPPTASRTAIRCAPLEP